jgi:DNA-binding NtrC family response regulator
MARILVVDDEPEVQETLKRRLERADHTVHCAGTTEAALSMLVAGGPAFEIVITDMSMERESSGVEILESALHRDSLTAVIILTAYGNVRNAVTCMQMGAYDYVEKNIPDVDVFELITLKANRAAQQIRDRRSGHGSVIRGGNAA